MTLTASATLSQGLTASYAWAEVKSDGTVQTFTEDEASFTLPAGVSAGVHTYRVSVTAGGYTLSKDIQITVTKAPGTLENKDYPTQFTYGDTVPTPKAEKNRRFDRLCAVQNAISEQTHRGYIGKVMRCLVDGRDGDNLTARTEGGRLVRFPGDDSLIGSFRQIEITGATTWSLVGTLAE